MKGSIKKFLLYFIIPLVLTTGYFYPVYKKIKIDVFQPNFESDTTSRTNKESGPDTTSRIDQEIRNLELPIKSVGLQNTIDRLIPIDRFQLCLKNNNKVYLVHADKTDLTYPSGAEVKFMTVDVSGLDKMKKKNIGALDIKVNYVDGETVPLYGGVGDPWDCKILEARSIPTYASSTVKYKYTRTIEITTPEETPEVSTYRDVSVTWIDTKSSRLIIIPYIPYFFLTLFAFAVGVKFILHAIQWIKSALRHIIHAIKKRREHQH